MATQKHIRTTILTISSIAITVTGAWYGLGLKTQQEIKEVHYSLPHTHTNICKIPFLAPHNSFQNTNGDLSLSLLKNRKSAKNEKLSRQT